MKKLINHPNAVVEEMTQGFLAMHSGLARLSNHTVLVRVDATEVRDRQVALISGGGSGHEPAHAGFIGAGMLSAAVAGQIFTSPPTDSILAAIQAVAGSPGVLLIVKNYTGDRLNFGLAAEMARSESIQVETVIVADDVALARTHEPAARRGIAGTVLVHKIAGAAAAEGRSLAEVKAIAQATADAVSTMGISLSAGTVPSVGKPSYVLGEQEVELGLGIHGEPGVRRALLTSADELADELVETILSACPLARGARVALLVNNLGATTTMELSVFARRALMALESRGLLIERIYSGTFISSLDAAGVSLSILPVDEDRLRWLDAPTSAPAWPNASKQRPGPLDGRTIRGPQLRPVPHVDVAAQPLNKMQRAIDSACRALIDAEGHLTELDQATGDSDLGINLARGAKAVKEALPLSQLFSPPDTLLAMAHMLRETVGGSSGPFYAVALMRAAGTLRAGNLDHPQTWAKASLDACHAVSELGNAAAGDRTMLDALLPFANTFIAALEQHRPCGDALDAAVGAAEAGAEATAGMMPRRGRSSYLGERVLGYPDPGAVAVAIWLRAVVSEIAYAPTFSRT